jgi:hypothetical protein
MTTRKPLRSQWTRQPDPKPEPVEAAHTKALRLPRPGPGIVISVPLGLLPEYLEIYRLAPSGARPDGTLLVTRTRKEPK